MLAVSLFAAPLEARANGVAELIGIGQRTRLAEKAQALGEGGYELTDGTQIKFKRWYEQKWIDIQFEFATTITENFGLVWGFSTGEFGEKYRIAPSFRVGGAAQTRLGRHGVFAMSVTRLFGGRLSERPCTADYGEIGGVQSVNCRLAASMLEPSDTLNYLVRASPKDRWTINVRYQLVF